ncbi:Intraflagellar transport protein 46 [Bulinus truncatus]|nr:Intraflagellar transport protein 46 [Bulinus truncatus]
MRDKDIYCQEPHIDTDYSKESPSTDQVMTELDVVTETAVGSQKEVSVNENGRSLDEQVVDGVDRVRVDESSFRHRNWFPAVRLPHNGYRNWFPAVRLPHNGYRNWFPAVRLPHNGYRNWFPAVRLPHNGHRNWFLTVRLPHNGYRNWFLTVRLPHNGYRKNILYLSNSKNARLHQNQPYDESLEVPDSEEIASTYSPTPRMPHPAVRSRDIQDVKKGIKGKDHMGKGTTPPGSHGDPSDQSDDQYEETAPVPKITKPSPQQQPRPVAAKLSTPQQQSKPGQQFNSDDDDDSEEEDDDDDDDDDEDQRHVEGAYDPTDYENLSVSAEIKELFQYITRYTPQAIELDHKLKPFIPDYIPAVGDIDAFIKIPRPDKKPDTLGLTVLDEPCAKQSDPTVLDLQLRAISKQTTAKQLIVKSLHNAEKNPKHIESWIENIRELHRSKPPPNVHYSKNMPDIDTLMQEWPPTFEQLLKEVSLPTAELDCDLGEYVDIIAAMLDIPIYKNSPHHNERIQALHVLFTLYSEFKNSQHFRALAEENKLDNALKEDGADRFVL